MLLGKDDVILNVTSTYVTNALVRKVNMDCYDDREIINNEYSRAVTPQIRQTGNRLSGNAETAYASLLA